MKVGAPGDRLGVFWVVVAVATLAFAVLDLEALRRRSMSRWHGASVAIYVLAWVIVIGLGLPIAPLGSVWWIFPVAVRIGVAAAFGGGQLLAEVIREEQLIAHPERRPPKLPSHNLSEEELRDAEAYDSEWQIEDRRRNRQRERWAREEREMRSHPPHEPQA